MDREAYAGEDRHQQGQHDRPSDGVAALAIVAGKAHERRHDDIGGKEQGKDGDERHCEVVHGERAPT
jgi:hypothetical protein